jgi:hypothetical protein
MSIYNNTLGIEQFTKADRLRVSRSSQKDGKSPCHATAA